MADVAQLIETMHPMREPAAPEAVAPYLLLLAIGCGAAAMLVFMAWRLRRRRRALRASADAVLDAARGLGQEDRLAVQANLLRRLVRRLAGDDAARAQGATWLESLDRVFATRFFTQGAGVAFGDALYRPARDVDVEALDRSLRGLIAKVHVR